jgi:Methyl-accepting chemotaxis protein
MFARLRQLLRTSAMRLALRYAILQTLLLAVALVVLLAFANRYVAAQLEAGSPAKPARSPRCRPTRWRSGWTRSPTPPAHAITCCSTRRAGGWRVISSPGPTGLAANGRAARVRAHVVEHDEPGHSERLDLVARGSVLAGGARLAVAQEPGAAEDLRDYVFAAAGVVLALSGLLSLVLGLALGWQWLTRIEAINRTAGAIAAGDFSQRVDAHGRGDEFDLLAGHLNHMLERIEAAVAGMRAVSDNVAHDLRRPLARLKTRIEVLLEHPRAADDYRALYSKPSPTPTN